MVLEQAKVERLLPVQQGVSKTSGKAWMSMDFVVVTNEQYPKQVVFTIFGEERIKQANLKEGLIVNVSFDLESRFYTDKNNVERYNTSARAFKVEAVGEAFGMQASPINYDQQAQAFFEQQPAPAHTQQQSFAAPSQQQAAPYAQPQYGGASGAYSPAGGQIPQYGQGYQQGGGMNPAQNEPPF